MSFRIQYSAICSVNLWHDFVLARGETELMGLETPLREEVLADYSIHDSLLIQPAEETRVLLRRHRLRFLPGPTGFALAGPVRKSASLAGQLVLETPLPEDFNLRFTVRVIRPAFLHETELPAQPLNGSLLLFSNRTDNLSVEGEPHLTRPLQAFDPSKAYQAGDRVVDQEAGPTVLLEAAEDVTASPAPASGKWVELPAARHDAGRSYVLGERVLHNGSIFEARNAGPLPPPPSEASWTKLYDAQLRTGVSTADLVRGLGRETRLELNPALSAVRITVRDRNNQIVLQDTQFRRDFQLLEEVRLSLPSAPPGLYSLSAEDPSGSAVASLPASFYLHEGPLPFAVIELTKATGAFALFDGQGHLQRPDYQVRFRHRRAFWRYVFHGDLSGFPPDNTGDLAQEDPADLSRYTTTRPLPVNAGMIALQAFDGRRLPNPGPSSSRKERGKRYLETFLTR